MNAQNNGSQVLHDGAADGIPDAVTSIADRSRDKSIWPMPSGLEAAARQAREAAEQFSRTLSFSGEERERLVVQSKKNMAAVKECRAILAQTFQVSSGNWMEMVHGQWRRNFDGMERLMQATSFQAYAKIQRELVRTNMEHILKDGRSIAERSMQAADEAGKALSGLMGPGTDDMS